MEKITALIEKRFKVIVCLFFVVYFLVGLTVFKDYGVSCDESLSRTRGILAFNYVFKHDKALLSYVYRYHGTAFEILLAAIEKTLNMTENIRTVYFMRHLATFLLFFTGVIFFYFLCKYRFQSWKVGLLGSLFLILSPRIFAHSFYNPKDIPFTAVFIISIYTLIGYLNKKTLSGAALHAGACAVLFNIRLAGIIVPLFTASFIIADLSIARRTMRRRIIGNFSAYLILLTFLIVLLWPVLWEGPLSHFKDILRLMQCYNWTGDVLYFGNYIHNTELPWHYIPVWIAISTPLLYTILFFIGSSFSISALLKNRTEFYIKRRDDLIFLMWFFLPLAAVIMPRSGLYDAWRHLFFIYPALLIFSLIGLTLIVEFIKPRLRGLRYTAFKVILILITVSSLLNAAIFMIRYHPYQNLFFNVLAGRDMEAVKDSFELDYWGLSYRKALEHILKNDKKDTIKIYPRNLPVENNLLMLPLKDKERVVLVEDPKKAGYFLTNYRWHKSEYPFKDEHYTVKIGDTKIIAVYKLSR
ncbi:MAG: glycosyltransferase family 39 protein [Candidatus Omnitrophica bacterium]|nr:glycosyltransferase family 39 protein [Candidatus Omnitrophota bacterium]